MRGSFQLFLVLLTSYKNNTKTIQLTAANNSTIINYLYFPLFPLTLIRAFCNYWIIVLITIQFMSFPLYWPILVI